MLATGMLLLGMLAVVGAATAVLLTRRNGRTENADGLVTEQNARDTANDNRSPLVHGLSHYRMTSPPTGDGFSRG